MYEDEIESGIQRMYSLVAASSIEGWEQGIVQSATKIGVLVGKSY